MGSKAEYEARKAERKVRRETAACQSDKDSAEMMEMMDRFVTAIERIADAMEHPRRMASHGPTDTDPIF
jgi:hypothetical protein